MEFLYEKWREDNRLVQVNRALSHTYPAHFHQNLEVYIIKNGSYKLEINGEMLSLKGGCVVVIDSYDVHEYFEGSERADDCVVVIPYRYLERFNSERKNRAVKNRVIKDTFVAERLLQITDEFISSGCEDPITDAGISLFLAVLLANLEFTDRPDKAESALIRSILSYIHENFRADICRTQIAKELGYTESHISRVFHRYLCRGISEYVAALRLGYIAEKQKQGDPRTLTELVYDSGFGSFESYYRWKRKHKASIAKAVKRQD